MGIKLDKQVAELTNKAAIKIATYYANVACPFIIYQPKMSNEVKNLRRK